MYIADSKSNQNQFTLKYLTPDSLVEKRGTGASNIPFCVGVRWGVFFCCPFREAPRLKGALLLLAWPENVFFSDVVGEFCR